MKLLFYALISSLLLYVSCQKELEIDYPDIEQRLVVNCFFTPDNLFNVRVGQILPLNDTTSTYIIDDAICKITENDLFAEQLQYTNNGFYVSENLKAKVGNSYRIEVSHPMFETVTATDTVPIPIEVNELYFEHNTLYDALDESYFHDMNIRFQDDVQKENYYEIRLVVESDNGYDGLQKRKLLLTKTNDLTLLNTGLIDYEPASVPFSDALFNGQNYFLSTYYKLPFASGTGDGNIYYHTHNIIVHFNAVSYQYYQYCRKMIMHLRNQESDIFEGIGDPIHMYSNIENGYGIFAAYNPNIDTLHHVFSWNKR